jgi:hypothetical protein
VTLSRIPIEFTRLMDRLGWGLAIEEFPFWFRSGEDDIYASFHLENGDYELWPARLDEELDPEGTHDPAPLTTTDLGEFRRWLVEAGVLGADTAPAVVEIAITDLEPDDVELVRVPRGTYYILTTEPCHVAHVQKYPTKGTTVLTIKGELA